MPEWTPEIEKWTKAQIRANRWRFDRLDEDEDVMQEARLLFHLLQQTYPVATDAPHFFSLYRTSLFRKFHDKSRKKLRTIQDKTVAEPVDRPCHDNCAALAILLDELPDELKLAAKFLTTGRVRLKLDKPARKLRQREGLNARLKRTSTEASTAGRVECTPKTASWFDYTRSCW
jgi:hypothetical protein